MCSPLQWKDQFRCSSFGLEYSTPRHFATFEFGYPKLYLAWRGLMAAYHLAMVILTGFLDVDTWTRTVDDQVKWFIYLTHWAFLSLAVSAIYQFLALVATYLSCGYLIRDDMEKMPMHLKICWVLHNVSNNASILITVLYWGLLYTPGRTVADIDMITHIGNTVYVVVNLFLSATPTRFYHFFHTVIFAGVYIIFTVIYYYAGGTNGLGFRSVYSVLDWSQPGTAALYSCLSALVGVPVIQFVLMLLTMLRVTLFDLCVNRRQLVDIELGMENKGFNQETS